MIWLYVALNAWADDLENEIAALPGMAWFHFNTTGHPVSWLQHTLFALGFTVPFALAGHAWLGAAIAFWFYVAREIYGGFEKCDELGFWPAVVVDRVPDRPAYQRGLYVGWGVDGLLDVVGPGLLWWVLR